MTYSGTSDFAKMTHNYAKHVNLGKGTESRVVHIATSDSSLSSVARRYGSY